MTNFKRRILKNKFKKAEKIHQIVILKEEQERINDEIRELKEELRWTYETESFARDIEDKIFARESYKLELQKQIDRLLRSY